MELHLYDLHQVQRQIRAEARRFNVVAAGRRSGKTTLGGDLVVETVLDDHAPCGWFTPTYKNLEETWREIKAILAPITTKLSETLHRIDVLGGGFIEFWSLESEGVADSIRGRHYGRVVVDEAASITALLEIWNKVIRPTLVDLRGDAWFMGSPKGLNAFHVLYQRGQDPLQENWASWQLPVTVNPHVDPAEIADIKAETPEDDFNQEYLAQFIAAGAAVFRHVDAAATAVWQAQRTEGHGYVVGADWGQVDDFTVFSVVDLKTLEQVHLERTNRTDYLVQAARLGILAEKFRPQLIVAEVNSVGRPVIELLRQRNLPVWAFETTNASKAAAVQALQLAFDERWIRILDDKVQTGELLAFTSERLPSGMLRYGAPEGMHDDTVIALALAWVGACAGEQRPVAREFRVESG